VPWHEEAEYRWRELRVPRRGGPGFAELPPSHTGIHFTNTVTLDSALWNRHLAQGGGVALGDVDGDGLPDVYLTSNQGSNVLYHNLGDWRFEDVTARAGVALAGRHSTGAVFADVDGDGDLDLLVSTLGGGVALFVNDGHGVFTERTAEAGLASRAGSMTMALTDVDGDGHLDLYVANYKTRSAMDVYPPQERAFNQVVREVGHHHFEVVPKFRTDYRVVDRPEYGLVSMQQRADPDAFYLNDGTGHFTLASWTEGRFRDETGKPLGAAPEYFALSAKFTDVDGDGAPDLYVCDDFEDPDFLWLNDGNGTFRAAPRLALRNTSNSSMAVDFSDVDRDGQVDIFVADMLGRGPRRKTEIPTHTPLPKLIGQIDDRPQWQRNTLLQNRGDGTFAEIAGFAGIDLIVLGGRLRHPNEAILGESVLAQLRHISPDRVFLGADGLVADRGVCCPSLEQSVVKHAMLHAGGEAYVLADHSKLGQAPFSYWAPLDREYRLITDEPQVDVMYPQFAQSVILAGGPETVGGAAHHGRRGS